MDYREEAQADADGNVRFNVPKILEGTTIQVKLSVRDENGLPLYIGKDVQTTAEGDMQVNLRRADAQLAPSNYNPGWGYTKVGCNTGGAPAFDCLQLESGYSYETAGLQFNLTSSQPDGVPFRYKWWTEDSGTVLASGEMDGDGFLTIKDLLGTDLSCSYFSLYITSKPDDPDYRESDPGCEDFCIYTS